MSDDIPDPRIFREYDIRGRVTRDLTPEVAFDIGHAFGTYLRRRGARRAALGRDNRASSVGFARAAKEGLGTAGIAVTDLGLVATPVFYYSTILYGTGGGIMVTGSHNPPEDNGFKLAFGDRTLHGPEIQELRQTIDSGEFITVPTGGRGRVDYRDPHCPYLAMLQARLAVDPARGRRLKVAVDAGNGVAGLYAPRLLRALGCDVVPLFCDPDPDFPNHFPDPVVPANLAHLVEVVKREECDVGLGFDGDGDRLGVVDDRGGIVWGDRLMTLFWREILPRYPGVAALVEVKCSQALVEEIERLGGRPVFCRTGHSLVKAKMKETGAPFAGEMSGHLFFADEYFGFDDAIYAGGRLVRLLLRSGRRLSELLDDIPRYEATREVRVKCPEEAKLRVVEAVRESLAGEFPIIDVDGVRALYPDGWGLVRASNTEAALVMRAEGRTPEALARIKSDLDRRLALHPEVREVEW